MMTRGPGMVSNVASKQVKKASKGERRADVVSGLRDAGCSSSKEREGCNDDQVWGLE